MSAKASPILTIFANITNSFDIFMYSIYFNNRIIQVCKKSSQAPCNPNAIVLNSANDKTLGELPCLFESNENIKLLCIPVEEEQMESTFNTICSGFTPINAAGGLVSNNRGEYLLIYRNGLWDLPKGKQEEGEDIAVTALREVEEECGLGSTSCNADIPAGTLSYTPALVQGNLICITHHTYHMNGLHMLKHTYWYNMKYTGDTATLTPQTEEGIQKCEWVAAEKLPEYLQDTYPSIRKVFESAGLI